MKDTIGAIAESEKEVNWTISTTHLLLRQNPFLCLSSPKMIVQLTKVEFAAREMEHIIRSVPRQEAMFPNPLASKRKWAGEPG